MVFSKTGAVPLEIGPGTAESRAGIGEALDLNPHCVRCMSDLAQFCRDVRGAGLPFTVVLGPVRPDMIEQSPKIRAVIADRRAQIRALVQECDAQLFDVTDYASLDDSCFANTLHLNAQGMSAMTAQLVRSRRGESIPKGAALTCGGPPLATTSGTLGQRASIARARSD